MRRFGFTTLIDPFEARFGKRWAAVLFLPALAGELFWSAELLVAIGSTFGVLLGMNLTTAILLSAVVTTATRCSAACGRSPTPTSFSSGSSRSASPRRCRSRCTAPAGCSTRGRPTSRRGRRGAASSRRCSRSGGSVDGASVDRWWDVSLMLIFGGIPWNCYFQRVLSCRTPRDARRAFDSGRAADDRVHRAAAADGRRGVRLSVAGRASWRDCRRPRPKRCRCSSRTRCRRSIGLLGLAAIIGAVTSSFSSSILSAGSMLSWNCLKRLVWPSLSVAADEARDPLVDRLLFGARRDGARAESAKRAGALVLHERSGVRAAVPAAGVGAVRPARRIAPDRSRPSPCRSCCGSAAASRCSGCRRCSLIRTRCRSGPSPPLPVSCCCRSSRARRRGGIAPRPLQNPRRSGRRQPHDGSGFRVARASLHRSGAGVRRRHGRADRARRRRLVARSVPADDGRHRDRRHRRLAGAQGARQAGAARLRRHAARQPRSTFRPTRRCRCSAVAGRVLAGALAWLLLLPLLASAYGFSQVERKRRTATFSGSPRYGTSSRSISTCCTRTCGYRGADHHVLRPLTFVPTPYLYATRGGPFATLINAGSAIWFVALGAVLFGREDLRRPIALVSLAYPVMYLSLSAFVAFTRKR